MTSKSKSNDAKFKSRHSHFGNDLHLSLPSLAPAPHSLGMIAIYIMASRSRTLYIGVTSDLRHRVWQHKNGTHHGFTSKYRITRLVYYEEFVLMQNAIAREKQLKRWSRTKKLW